MISIHQDSILIPPPILLSPSYILLYYFYFVQVNNIYIQFCNHNSYRCLMLVLHLNGFNAHQFFRQASPFLNSSFWFTLNWLRSAVSFFSRWTHRHWIFFTCENTYLLLAFTLEQYLGLVKYFGTIVLSTKLCRHIWNAAVKRLRQAWLFPLEYNVSSAWRILYPVSSKFS